MRTALISVVFCGLLATTLAGDDAAPRMFQSVTARNAQARYRNELLEALRKFDAQITPAREAYLRALKVSLSGETKAGNLAEANKVQAEIEEIEAAKLKVATGKPAAPSGKFKIQFPGGNEQTFTFDGKSGVSVIADGRAVQGRVLQRGDQWYVDLGDRDTNRITIAGNRIFVEHWRQEERGYPHSLASGFTAD